MATDAEDDESDIGEIIGGEEPEMQFTDGDGLRRLPSNEAPLLVGEWEGDGGGGEEEEEEEEEEDSEAGLSEGEKRRRKRNGTDPLDLDSNRSVLLSECDETHKPDPGSCNVPCNNSYKIDCHCECETCMFKHLNDNPPNHRKFKKLLRRNFRSAGSNALTDPLRRNFRARRPYDYTQDSATQPCTEMIPWGVNIRKWNKPCPNKRRRERGRYDGKVLPCDEVFCDGDLNALSERCERRHGSGLPDALWDQVKFPADDGPVRPYVCESHIQDTKDYFHMGAHADNLYKSHLVRFCKVHEAELLAKRPESTCTCRNVDFNRWQCRSCFQEKVEKLQRHFRRRVNPRWRGCADTSITNGKFYQRDWKGVRRMLQREHPCLKGHCGRPRLKGLVRNEVLDCRCCGGHIVQPLRRSTRLAGRRGVAYAEEDMRENSAEGSGAED
ncbi:hypothetical protein HO133_003407 [Letharia lupina]|uniref:Uncharacterized protein n=1 Tax=Letharia lupina TaxID=560253 RepID=A0A8H6CB27_9LECA|nr:uncharacterized protein HO133_003407 [Letharia lupina]KAF6220275.1 hypothetical protein HO133_003407 [Letharia lupina]